jgi:hypothetical protein
MSTPKINETIAPMRTRTSPTFAIALFFAMFLSLYVLLSVTVRRRSVAPLLAFLHKKAAVPLITDSSISRAAGSRSAFHVSSTTSSQRSL